MIRVFSALKIEAAASVVIKVHGGAKSIKGGVRVKVAIVKTAAQWCAYWGVAVTKGVAVLFKAVDDKFHSPKGADYSPGNSPEATDWDGGNKECGGGLHFSPHPEMARDFNSDATKYVACPVAIKDMRAPKKGDEYPQKIKAKRVAGKCYEVDRSGEKK